MTTKSAAALWTHDPERVGAHVLSRPTLLVSAAAPDALATWYEAHPWALDVPLVLWHHDEVDTVALRVLDRASRERGDDGHATHRYLSPGPGPCCVTATGALLRAVGLGYAECGPDDPARIRAAVLTARAVSREATRPGALVWEVCAEASGGVLAVGAALGCGRAVAVSHELPGPLFTHAADLHRVTVRAWLDREVRARLLS